MSNNRIMVAETTMRNDRLNKYVILQGGHYRCKEYIIAKRMQKIMPLLICNLKFWWHFVQTKSPFEKKRGIWWWDMEQSDEAPLLRRCNGKDKAFWSTQVETRWPHTVHLRVNKSGYAWSCIYITIVLTIIHTCIPTWEQHWQVYHQTSTCIHVGSIQFALQARCIGKSQYTFIYLCSDILSRSRNSDTSVVLW